MHRMLGGLERLYRQWKDVEEALMPPSVQKTYCQEEYHLRPFRVTMQAAYW